MVLLVGNIESNPGPESAYISSTRLSAVDILSDKFISISNINIRSIRNKINFLQNFVDEFDIIVLTETHPDNSIENRHIELDPFMSICIIQKKRVTFGMNFNPNRFIYIIFKFVFPANADVFL
jgi:hypothetical protein